MRFLLSIMILIWPLHVCFAGLGTPIVWLADNVSLSGYKRIVLHPVSNDTGEKFDFNVANTIAESLRDELIEAGFEVLEPSTYKALNRVFVMKISIVFYTPGDVGGRWIGWGGGASICILRSVLMDENGVNIIGEIIVANQVSGGGLFSAGAGKSVPVENAKRTVGQLLKLVELE